MGFNSAFKGLNRKVGKFLPFYFSCVDLMKDNIQNVPQIRIYTLILNINPVRHLYADHNK